MQSAAKGSARRWLVTFAAAAVLFAVLDAAWIAAVASRQYQLRLGPLVREQPNWLSGLAFYPLFVAGVVTLAVRPEDDSDWRQRAVRGALLGAVAYGTWGLTANAVLRDFPLDVALTDLAWGAVSAALVAALTPIVVRRFTH